MLATTQDSGDTIRKFLNQVNIDAVKKLQLSKSA